MGFRSWLSQKIAPATAPGPDRSDPDERGDGTGARRTPRRFHARLSEGVFGLDPDAGTEWSDKFFSSVGGGAGSFDLPPDKLKKAQEMSLLLYRKNPRAWPAIELVKDFVLGDGVRFKAKDPEVQALLDKHWTANQWAKKGEERLRALAIFGEQLYPAFVNPTTGMVRISSVSPLKITSAVSEKENAEELDQVKTSVGGSAELSAMGKDFKVIRPNDEGILEGEAFYFAVNRITGSLRGVPDLVTAIDWLEALDGFVFATAERADAASNVVYDVLYKNLQPEEIRKKVEEFVKQIRDGGVYGHNENVELTIKTPNLQSADAEGMVKILLKQIQSGTRLAGLFYGDSDDLTRASASELSVPVAKMIQSRQAFFKRMLEEIFTFQIQQAQKAGTLKAEDTSFAVIMPPVFLRDLSTVTQAIVQITTALQTAVDQQWLTADEARAVFRLALEQLTVVGESDEDGEEAGGEPTPEQTALEGIYKKAADAP